MLGTKRYRPNPREWGTQDGTMQPRTQRATPVTPVTVTEAHCSPADVRRILHETPFFRELPVEEIPTIASVFRQRHYAAGEPIYHAGEEATRLLIVAAGMVRIVRPTIDGQDVLLDFAAPGAVFGSLRMLGDAVYTDGATALTGTCILQATPEAFRDLLARYPAAAMATLGFVAERLREAHVTIEGLSAHPVPRRVAATLLKLADRVGRAREADMLIDMPLSRQDLADMTGATIETVSRVMSDLRTRGIIDSGRRWVSIVDLASLERIAAGDIGG
jgi:CRP-like cAMP-binding protein